MWLTLTTVSHCKHELTRRLTVATMKNDLIFDSITLVVECALRILVGRLYIMESHRYIRLVGTGIAFCDKFMGFAYE